MPYTNIIATAGISALGARNLIGQALRSKNSPLKFEPGMQNPISHQGEVNQDKLIKQTLDFLAQQAPAGKELDKEAYKQVSAEFSVLNALKNGQQLSTGAVVQLIHTPTLGGRLAVEALRPYFDAYLDAEVIAHEISVPFDPAQPGGLALASGAFIGLVSKLLCQSHPASTAFAPIGGYKVMVALGHTAASFHGFESLYLHEDSQILQRIAPAPNAMPESTRQQLSPLAHKVGNGIELSTLSTDEQRLITNNPTFFTHVDGLVELNELGQFLRLDSLIIKLSKEAKEEIMKDAKVITAQLQQLSAKAAADPEAPGINHDLVSARGRNHPWRLAQMGKGYRIAWQIDSDVPQILLIRKIWTNHSLYEKEAPALITENFSLTNVESWTTLEAH